MFPTLAIRKGLKNLFRFHLAVGLEVCIEPSLGADAGEAGHGDGAKGREVPAGSSGHSSELLGVASAWTKPLL